MGEFLSRYKQIISFVLVGASSALIELMMMRLFSHFIPQILEQESNFYGLKYPISNVLSTSLAILVNYWLSIKFVFKRGRYGRRKEFLYFVLITGVTTVLSLLVFQVYIHYIFLKPIDIVLIILSPIILSKITAIGTVSILNFTIKKNIIFKE